MDHWTIAVLGPGGVGKTALVIQFTLNCFHDPPQFYDPTIEDGYRKQFIVDNRMCFVEVIDTAGQEEYAALRDQWVREAQGFILIYTITSRWTFEKVGVFHESVRSIKKGPPILVLVGNKADAEYNREVSKEEGVALAQQFGCEFIEVSAKTGQNVERAFASVLRALREPGLMHASRLGGRPGERERKKRRCIIM